MRVDCLHPELVLSFSVRSQGRKFKFGRGEERQPEGDLRGNTK